MKALLDAYLQKYDELRVQGRGVGLYGTPGAGKTYGAAALARALVHRGVDVRWAPTVEVFNQLLDFRDFRISKYFQLKYDLKATEVVIFDDVGQLRDYPRIREVFFEVIDERYSWQRPTIFTANMLSDINLEEELTKYFNTSLARRMQEMTKGFTYINCQF